MVTTKFSAWDEYSNKKKILKCMRQVLSKIDSKVLAVRASLRVCFGCPRVNLMRIRNEIWGQYTQFEFKHHISDHFPTIINILRVCVWGGGGGGGGRGEREGQRDRERGRKRGLHKKVLKTMNTSSVRK